MRRTIHLSIAALAVLLSASTGVAQEASSALLNTLDVRELVARGEPADSVRLSGHFTALADRYTAEARQHTSMAERYAGNPSRSFGSGMSAHCRRLADLNTQSATTLRELAVYHEKRATGAPAAAPRDGARFEAGGGAPKPTEKDLAAMAARAGTPDEHRSLMEYFLTLAKRHAAEAQDHVALAQALRGTRIAQSAVHHDRLAKVEREVAKEATAAADMHKQLAGVGR
jgi:hypothetical protein